MVILVDDAERVMSPLSPCTLYSLNPMAIPFNTLTSHNFKINNINHIIIKGVDVENRLLTRGLKLPCVTFHHEPDGTERVLSGTRHITAGHVDLDIHCVAVDCRSCAHLRSPPTTAVHATDSVHAS